MTAGLRRRRRIRSVFVALLLLLLADTVLWAILCRRLEAGLREVADRQSGWTVAAEGEHWGGWPFSAAVELSGVSAEGTLLPGLVWRSERVRVALAFLHPTELSVRAGGAQSVAARGIAPVPFTADLTELTADLTGAAPPHGRIAGLRATLPAGGMRIATGEITLPPDTIVADVAGVSLPQVSTAIDSAHLRARITPSPPVAATPRASASAWRAAGGQIEIAEAEVHWDRLDAAGTGTITLDDALQPHADGMIDAGGLPQLLDDLVKAGALAPAQAGAAKAVIAILAAPSGGKRVRLPVSLESGVLRLANFPLVRFPPLSWD